MKQFLPILSIVPLLTAGCTPMLLGDSFTTRTTPFGAASVPGYRPPVATKAADGGVTFEYDAARYRVGLLGDEPDKSQWRLQRITNTLSSSGLQPVTNLEKSLAYFNSKIICPPASNEMAFVEAGQKLPTINRELSQEGFDLFPASEGVFFAGQWVWYVPAHGAGDLPRAAVLSKESQKTSVAFVPVKVALLPVALGGDAVALPFYPLLYLAFKDVH